MSSNTSHHKIWDINNILAGATATNLAADSGAVLYITVVPDTYIQGTIAGKAFGVQNGIISGYAVNSGVVYISSGGMALATTVNKGGRLLVNKYGVAGNISVCSGGFMGVYSSGAANNVTIKYSGSMFISDGAQASGTIVDSGGVMNITSGGLAFGTLINSGDLHISSGGSAAGISVNSGGRMLVRTGGRTGRATVTSDGVVMVWSGASVNTTTVDSGGRIYTYSGGMTDSTTLNAGAQMIAYAGSATNLVADSRAYLGLYVCSNAYVRGTVGGSAFELKDASLSGYAVNSGFVTAISGGRLDHITVGKSGALYVSSGGTATDIVADAKAKLSLAVASNTYFRGTMGGSAVVMQDGVLSGYTTSSGEVTVSRGGSANRVTVKKDAYLAVYSGGTATNIVADAITEKEFAIASNTYIQGTIAGKAFEMKNATLSNFTASNTYLYVSSGGRVNSTTLKDSDLIIKNGGTASNTVVNDDGCIDVNGYGTVSNTTLNKDGELYVSRNGVITGQLQIAKGAIVEVSSGARINFDVANQAAPEQASINNLGLVSGWQRANFSITVKSEPSGGIYALADGAANFNGTMSVLTTSGVTIGDVSLTNPLTIDNTTYSLVQRGESLLLSIFSSNRVAEGGVITGSDATAEGDIGSDGNFEDTFGLRMAYSGKYRLSGDFGILNGSITVLNGKKKVASGKIKNGILTFNSGKFALLDGGVDYSVSVKNSDKGKTASEYQFAVTADAVFDQGDNSDDWTDMKTAGADGHVASLGVIDAATPVELVSDGWAGYGDAIDYMSITLDTAAKLRFDLAADDACKFTVYSLKSKTNSRGVTSYSLKSLQATTLKAAKGTSDYLATSKDLLLNAGTYYIAMQSTNAKKGGDADYTIALNADSEFFPAGDNSDDSWKLAAGQTPAEMGSSLHDWVGFGDSADFFKFEVDAAGKFTVDLDMATVEAVANKELKFSCVNELGKSVALAMQDADTFVSKKDVAAGVYYLGITCANPKKFDTSYGVTLGMLA